MKKAILVLALCMIGLSGASESLIQPYQIKLNTNGWTRLPVSSNLTGVLLYLDQHIDDYSEQGYATTNQLIAATNAIYADLVGVVNSNVSLMAQAVSNATVLITNNVMTMITVANVATTTFDIVTTSAQVGITNGWAYTLNVSNAFSKGVFTSPTNGYYHITVSAVATIRTNTTKQLSIIDLDSNVNYGYSSALDNGSEVGLTTAAGVYLAAGQRIGPFMYQESPYMSNISARIFIMKAGGL